VDFLLLGRGVEPPSAPAESRAKISAWGAQAFQAEGTREVAEIS
jgi:hypothetical protein